MRSPYRVHGRCTALAGTRSVADSPGRLLPPIRHQRNRGPTSPRRCSGLARIHQI